MCTGLTRPRCAFCTTSGDGSLPHVLGLSCYRALAHLRSGNLADAEADARDIAQNLFITTRTVEGHLTHAYQKLDITSREQLPAALTPPGGETTAPAPAFR
jgi:hypothetical protein